MAIETIAKELKTLLQNNLPAKIAEVNTAWNDGITLINPAAYYTNPLALYQHYPMPAVFITGRTRLQNLTASGGRQRDHSMEVRVIVDDREPDKLQAKVWRYAQAVEKVLNPTADVSAEFISFEITEEDYGFIEGSENRMGALITVLIMERT